MKTHNIDWIIYENEEYIQENEYYLGSFTPDNEIKLSVLVWNNRYGEEDIETIPNARLAIYFESLEDSILLKYLTVNIDNENANLEVDINKGLCYIGELSGSSNSGIINDNNSRNYKNVNLIFSGFPTNLTNGLKEMYLDIEVD